MKYYHSGLNQRDHIQALDRAGVRGMVNASTIIEPAVHEAARESNMQLVLDSGAFQGLSDVTVYARVLDWLGTHGGLDIFNWYASLDVIGDQKRSNANLDELRSHGFDPLPVYQVDSADWELLHAMGTEEDLIGIGGLVPHAMRSRANVMGLLNQVDDVLGGTSARVHVFGIGSPVVLEWLRWHPWCASADSQKWLQGKRARALYRANGDRILARNHGFAFTPMECAVQNMRVISGWAGDKDASAGFNEDLVGDLFTPHHKPSKMPEPQADA